MALGPSVSGTMPAALRSGLEPLAALAAGWLALSAAGSWDLATLERLSAARRIFAIGIVATLLGGLAVLWPATALAAAAPVHLAWLVAPAAALVCAAAAVDPGATRLTLEREERPDAAARLAPSAAGLALGAALAGSALVPSLLATTTGDPLSPWRVAAHAALTLALGLCLGLAATALLRLADGRGMLLAVLASLTLGGWGLARWLGMSPLAMLFAAGLLLANEAGRRDLVRTLLVEWERPLAAALLVLVGASIPLSPIAHWPAVFWLAALTFTAARPLAWRLVPGTGLRADQALAMSPLAIVLSLETIAGDAVAAPLTAWAPAAVAVAFVGSEIGWLLIARKSPAARDNA